MITTKQRATLKALAQNITPNIIIGKGAVTDNVIEQIDIVLENKELVKIKALKTADIKVAELINELAKKVNAEPITALGGVMVLYRYSNKKDVKHIEF